MLTVLRSVAQPLTVRLAALSLGMGVILYISAVNDEVAHRKKSPTSASGGGGSDVDQEFSYRYGWAFFFGGATFVCAMAAAVSNISLYLHRYSHFDDMMLIVPTTGSGAGGGTTGSSAGGRGSAAESSSDAAGVYRPVRWTDVDDDPRRGSDNYVGSARAVMASRWSDVKDRKLAAAHRAADRRLYESDHSISIPL